MSDDALVSLAAPARESNPPGELLRSGGRRAIEAAVSAEFESCLSGFVRVKRLARANGHTHPYLAQLATNDAENPPNPEQLPDNRPVHRRSRTRRQCTSMGSSGRSVQADVFHTGPVGRFESSFGRESSGPDAPPDRTVPSPAGLTVDELFEDAGVVPMPHRLMPAREIPSMNVFWANRKANSSGALIITAAAMRPP